jgi:hypothetical protein
MRVCEKAFSGDRYSLMVRSRTWIDRLPRWPNAPEVPSPSGSSMGPRERLLLVIAMV